MKECLHCGQCFDATEWECPGGCPAPQLIDGYLTFSPLAAQVGEGFRPDFFAALARLEARNFWFRARNQLITWALRRHFPQVANFLEIGCGTGFVLSGIAAAFPHLQLFGSEYFTAGLPFAQRRLPKATFYQTDARAIPFANEFDLVGAFDVLEHIRDDEQVLRQMFKAVRPGGGVILTVPQHTFLWSRADEHACHVRRYGAKELRRKVAAAGFRIDLTTSFVSFLLPLMAASRLLNRNSGSAAYDPCAELKVSGFANILMEKILGLERMLLNLGVRYPMGGSLLLVAHKP